MNPACTFHHMGYFSSPNVAIDAVKCSHLSTEFNSWPKTLILVMPAWLPRYKIQCLTSHGIKEGIFKI